MVTWWWPNHQYVILKIFYFEKLCDHLLAPQHIHLSVDNFNIVYTHATITSVQIQYIQYKMPSIR